MKKVAVLMCVYKNDSPCHLKLAIESILHQTYNSIDLYLFIDGKIPVDIKDAIDTYKTYNNFFVVANDTNIGLARGLNYLIDATITHTSTSYDYLARMDSDDISRLNRIESQVEFMENNLTVGVSGTWCKEFGTNFSLDVKKLPLLHDELVNFSMTRCPFIHPTVIFRANVFKLGSRYPENTKLTEDMALWFDLLVKGVEFANLPEVLLDYRVSSDMLTRRSGFGKGMSEFTIRFKNMIALKRVTFYNIIFIFLRLGGHILPANFLKLIYKYFR